MFVNFGCGDIYFNPIAGNQAPNPTPGQALGVQDVSLEIDQKLVELKSQNKGPDDVAAADMTVKGKLTMGRMDLDLLNNSYFAETPSTGQTSVQVSEADSVPGTPFQVTVTHSATFVKDLGVRLASNAQPFTRVASSPTQGQYSVSAGIYTFASTDTLAAVVISYTYTQAAVGRTMTVHNQLMGYGPVVEMYLWEPYASTLNINSSNGMHLYAVRFGKAGVNLKRDDFTYPALEFEAYPNAAGQWFDIIDGVSPTNL